MTAEAQYKEFVASIKQDVPAVVKLIQEVSKMPYVLVTDDEQYKRYDKVAKNLLAIMRICTQIYKKAGDSEEKLAKNREAFTTKILDAIVAMDCYEGEYDVQGAVRECFLRQAKKGDVRLSPVETSSAVGEAENHILYDDNFYYVADSTLRKICIRLIWIKKESLMTDEGLLLENMWEDKAL